MAYVNLLNQLPQNGKGLFRKLESSNCKLIKLKWSKTFNEICLKEDILPNYTRIITRVESKSHKSAICNSFNKKITLYIWKFCIESDMKCNI